MDKLCPLLTFPEPEVFPEFSSPWNQVVILPNLGLRPALKLDGKKHMHGGLTLIGYPLH